MHRLRRRPQRSERVNDRAFADCGDAGNMNLGDEANAVAKLNIRPDYTIGADLDALADARPIGHARGWIDRHLIPG